MRLNIIFTLFILIGAVFAENYKQFAEKFGSILDKAIQGEQVDTTIFTGGQSNQSIQSQNTKPQQGQNVQPQQAQNIQPQQVQFEVIHEQEISEEQENPSVNNQSDDDSSEDDDDIELED